MGIVIDDAAIVLAKDAMSDAMQVLEDELALPTAKTRKTTAHYRAVLHRLAVAKRRLDQGRETVDAAKAL